ncbi:hypothetical protein KM427_23070 [Nocardioides sp. LMS-CY]|uniref:hypothetical protein n=1 Tax=Nocardioides sp. (strain LMS-CY) TaxID=2840457 RepID=UPI001C001CD2|nr:hypothetical protein [Nocardioides sp. LMS-CY]QWF21772.1 hypothetical protein KM427_23070 [Nocardioides sp. LMS-CY]
MYFTAEERVRYDAEEVRYKERHGSCGSHRHRVSGSLTTHCGKCCPSPPLSPDKAREIGTLLRSMSENRPPEDLMRWRLRLFCGHVVERTAHRSYTDAGRAFTMSTNCPECGLDPATIIDAQAVGLLAEPHKAPHQPPPRSTSRPTRAALEKRVADLEAELAALKRT